MIVKDTKSANLIFKDITDEEIDQINQIMKESANPYESFVNTFGDKFHINYDYTMNTFYFARK